MLDQNTDRMWYVIGAVLIGAAIIFGMNTLMPEAFASVGGMFQDIMGEVDIKPDTRQIVGENRIRNGTFSDGLSGWGVNGVAEIVEVDGRTVAKLSPSSYNSGGGIHQSNLLDGSRAVEIRFDAKTITPNAVASVGFLNTSSAKRINLSDEWETYTFRVDEVSSAKPGWNIFHIYVNYNEFYVDNVEVYWLNGG